MDLVDTHCHLHSLEFFTADLAEEVVQASVKAGVKQMLGIATSLDDSTAAISFAHNHSESYWASIGIHPHEALKLTDKEIEEQLAKLDELASDPKVIAVGECGLDFYYNNRSEALAKQIKLLEGQLEIAKVHNLPVSFHVREAFDDFWPIYEKYKVSGVLHSFTDSKEHMKQALQHGLFIGVNGIATFTKNAEQSQMYKSIPLENLLIETDAPFLTPVPKRGTINSPENVIYVTHFMAELRSEDDRTIARITTRNAQRLFVLT